MKKFFSFAVAAIFALTPLFLTSCDEDEDEETVDVRDQAVGTYTNANSSLYRLIGSDIKPILMIDTVCFYENPISDFSVKKSGAGLNVAGLNAPSVSIVSNGFSFDIANTSLQGKNVEGFDAIEVESANGAKTKANGAFFSSTKKISYGIKILASDFCELTLKDKTEEEQTTLLPLLAEALKIDIDLMESSYVVMIFQGTKK